MVVGGNGERWHRPCKDAGMADSRDQDEEYAVYVTGRMSSRMDPTLSGRCASCVPESSMTCEKKRWKCPSQVQQRTAECWVGVQLMPSSSPFPSLLVHHPVLPFALFPSMPLPLLRWESWVG